MTNVKMAIAACAGTMALACATVLPAKAADMPQYPQQYSGPPPVEQETYYQAQPRPYYQPAPPVVYQEYGPPAVVPVPGPYYGPPRRVYVDPGYAPGYRPYGYYGGNGYYGGYGYRGYGYGYRGYGYGPYVARGYGYRRW